MQPHPYQNLHQYPLTSSKNIWPKISVNLFILLVAGGCIFSISPCWTLNPHRVVKGPHFEAWTRPQPEITSANPARHLYLKPDLGLKAQFTEGVKIYAIAEQQKNVVCRCSYRYTLYHTENSNHLDQNIGIIWHKRSMLVNDTVILRSVEYNVSQEKKKLSRNYLRWRYRHKKLSRIGLWIWKAGL